MNPSALPPTTPTTLVILLGASAWPNSPSLQASKAFVNATQGFRDYLLDPQHFGLPVANLCDLFDAPSSSSEQLEMLGSFLEQRTQALKAENHMVRDVLVSFVGHGSFAGPSADFYLLPRRAYATSLRASGIAIDALAEVLREKARQTRRYLFLDCCFAAAVFKAFQGTPDQVAMMKTQDVFYVRARGSSFPGKGTVLLCSSNHKTPSLLLPDESCTMFSSALLDVLRNGDPHRPRQLSLRDIKELVEDRLVAMPPEQNAPRPDLHSPDQSEGDVADVPFFPNSSLRKARDSTPQPSLPPSPSRSGLSRRPVMVLVVLTLLLMSILGLSFFGVPFFEKQRQATATAQAQATANAMATTLVSAHGRMWTPQVSPTVQSVNGVVWSGLQYVAVGDAGTILTSSDGSAWIPQVSHTSQNLYRVIWSRSQYVVVGTNGTILLSSDGRTWTLQTSPTPQSVSGITWSGSQYVAVGNVGTILTSSDGQTWIPQVSHTSQYLFGVIWSGLQYVAVGDAGTILTSSDGQTWTSQVSHIPQSLTAVAWSRSQLQYVAVGDAGTILTSSDGQTWTPQVSHTPQKLFDVVWSGLQYVAVGDAGTILTSSDGQTWTSQVPRASQTLSWITWSGSQYVAVGRGGTILRSP